MSSVTNGIYTPSLSHPPPGNRQTGAVLSGEGVPSDTLGQNGDIYVDESTGDIYSKQSDTWVVISGPGAGSLPISPGVVDPEGVVTATAGQVYWNSNTQQLWVKQSGSGNTGWAPY